MRIIPKKLREELSNDEFMKTCVWTCEKNNVSWEHCWSREKHLREMVRITWSGLLGTEQEFDHKRHHPTQKPIELSVWFIDKYSEEGWKIVDLFGGSGSTLIACEKTNRKCYMMELDEKYCSSDYTAIY